MKRSHQLELDIGREPQPDRNFQNGGRSFYFFDLDDNVLYLPTAIFAFHRDTGQETELNTADYALYGADIGKRGRLRDFQLNMDDHQGSFRRFRDRPAGIPDGLAAAQPFVEDIARALESADFNWKGPSWNCFYHATFNHRPISLITARGHGEETIREGLRLLVDHGFLPHEPNYLTIYPVSHPDVRKGLGDPHAEWSVAKLKRAAIHRSVRQAMSTYGSSPFHRFGMSDDSPENLRLIEEAMVELKADFPGNSFYVIDTEGIRYLKREIFLDHVVQTSFPSMTQLDLFSEL